MEVGVELALYSKSVYGFVPNKHISDFVCKLLAYEGKGQNVFVGHIWIAEERVMSTMPGLDSESVGTGNHVVVDLVAKLAGEGEEIGAWKRAGDGFSGLVFVWVVARIRGCIARVGADGVAGRGGGWCSHGANDGRRCL